MALQKKSEFSNKQQINYEFLMHKKFKKQDNRKLYIEIKYLGDYLHRHIKK